MCVTTVWFDSVLYPYLRHSRVCGKQTEITAQLDMHPQSWRSHHSPKQRLFPLTKPKWAVCWQLPCICIVPCPGCFVNGSVPWQKNFLKREILSLFPCILSKAVLCCPWCCQHPGRRFPRRFFHRGWNNFFYPQSIKREGVADMNVTWSDLIQFCILIFAILAYAENKKK